MNIEKAYWVNENDTLRMTMPIMKVDKQNRIVSGFASLDNVDKHGDIVTAEASLNAFTKFSGNLREMHQPIAAGRVLSFSQEPYYDASTDTSYNGIFVNTYVSQGAESTWLKVLDGTLTGFSIGAKLKDGGAQSVYNSETDSTVRVITDIELVELSLVDNPANQYAQIVSIQKVDDEITVKGIAVGVQTSTVFWCEKDKSARTVDAEKAACPHCGGQMESIGWVEVGSNEVEKMREIVKNYTASTEDPAAQNSPESEGGVIVEKEDKTVVVDEVVEKTEEVPVEKTEDAAVGTTEETAPVVEETIDIAKALEDMKTFVADTFAGQVTELQKNFTDALDSVKAAFVEHKAAIDAELSAMREEYSAVAEKVDGVAPEIEKINGRVEAVEDVTATRKAGESGGSPTVKTEESVWKGAFSVATLTM